MPRIFEGFDFPTESLTYTVAGKGATAAREVIITN
jgi:hypothetical protein